MARNTGSGAWWRDPDHAPRHGLVGEAHYIGTEGDDHIHGRKTTDMIDGLGGDDVLDARYGDDVVHGGDGNDLVKGSAGRDMLYGDDGNDRLYGGSEQQESHQGGSGRDQLFGGAGDDRLYGGWESDNLEGGSGKDRFMYTAASDATIQHPDFILDFEKGKDKIVFGGEFKGIGLHFVGSNDFSAAPGELRFEVFKGENQSVLEIDIDGDGGADFRIAFVGVIHFQASDLSF